MKLNKLETHDRLMHLRSDQSASFVQGIEDCLKRNPNCVSMQKFFPYVYVFAHPRTAEDGSNKRMIWQPRLSKPKAQTNSYLFRALSNTTTVEIIWMIPPRELWEQYEKGKVTESESVMTSIANFMHHREDLERPHKDDFSEEKVKAILMSIEASQKPYKKI